MAAATHLPLPGFLWGCDHRLTTSTSAPCNRRVPIRRRHWTICATTENSRMPSEKAFEAAGPSSLLLPLSLLNKGSHRFCPSGHSGGPTRQGEERDQLEDSAQDLEAQWDSNRIDQIRFPVVTLFRRNPSPRPSARSSNAENRTGVKPQACLSCSLPASWSRRPQRLRELWRQRPTAITP